MFLKLPFLIEVRLTNNFHILLCFIFEVLLAMLATVLIFLPLELLKVVDFSLSLTYPLIDLNHHFQMSEAMFFMSLLSFNQKTAKIERWGSFF